MTRDTHTDSRGFLPRAPTVRATTRTQWAETNGDRPDDCICLAGDDLPCFPCYNAGFRQANPDGTGLDGGDGA